MAETLKEYLQSYAGDHFDELVDADYDIIVNDTLAALASSEGPSGDVTSDEVIQAVGILMFWARELTVVVGDKDDFARAKENYELAERAARKYLHETGSITGIRLLPKHYHNALDLLEEVTEPFNEWTAVL